MSRYRGRGGTVFHTGAAPQPKADIAPKPIESHKGPTIETALRDFGQEIQDNPQLSDAHKTTTTYRIVRLKKSLPLKSALSEIGHDEVAAIVRYWTSRPKSKSTGNKISLVSVKAMIATARQFFYWLEDTGKWTPPTGLKKLFSLNVKALQTNAERKKAATGIDTFSIADLHKLYTAANERTKLFMLLGLNCGFAQSEISSLTNWEIILRGGNPRIERHRRKTEVFGIWPLWNETVAALKSQTSDTPKNEGDLAITTSNGQPLVGYGGKNKSRTDAVGQSWNKLVKRMPNVPQLPFRFLRKTSADMIRKIAGRDMSEAFLAHADTGIAKLYTNADFEKVTQAVNHLRIELDPMFSKQ